MAPIKERRRRKRIDLALPIQLAYGRTKIMAKTKNISILGTYIEIAQPIPIGAQLDVQIKIPKTEFSKLKSNTQIKCQGVTFRCQPKASPGPGRRYGIGIFFRSFFAQGEKTLSRFVDYILLQDKKMGRIYMRKRKISRKKGGSK